MNLHTHLADLVSANPSTAPLLESLGLDFCCQGKRPLEQACQQAGLDPREVLARLEAVAAAASAPAAPVDTTDAAALVQHILDKHHTYVKRMLPIIQQRLAKVVKAHGARHPELNQVQRLWSAVHEELDGHLFKEEQILFPYIVGLTQAKSGGELPHACFGTVQGPIGVMEAEHDHAGEALAGIRQLTNNYTPPADACPTFQLVLDELKGFEEDLHLHVHRENYQLHPLALALEAELTGVTCCSRH